MDGVNDETLRKPHHERMNLCTTRPKYRDGRMLKAVKTYTVSDESQYLLIRGLSVVRGALEGLVLRLKEFGDTEEEKVLKDYPLEESEKFTQVVLVKFVRIQSARSVNEDSEFDSVDHSRIAKRKLDDLNYLGEVLHVCYAPEFESTEETRSKLEDRRKAVRRRLVQLDETTSKSGNVNNKILQRVDPMLSNHSHLNATVQDPNFEWHANGNGCSSKLVPRQIHKAVRNLDVNATLRRNALLTRGECQGPRLPEHVERKRKTFQGSEMGDESLDRVRREVRRKMADVGNRGS